MSLLEAVFNCQSVAVVGASASPEKTGHTVLKNILEGGYRGKVFPINPKAEEILGVKCFPSVREIPGTVDLVVVIVPGKMVPAVMREAGAKSAQGAVIISGGFRETGNADLENEVLAIAGQHGIRIIGPNCQGFNYTPNRLCASWPLVSAAGNIAVISQSGTVGAAMEMWAAGEQMGISGFVALGNKSDINESDLIDFFGSDPNTRVIALYVEGIKNGQAFREKAAATEKPLIVLKPGRTVKGRKAAESHTKSIAGSDRIFDAACRQMGIVRAYDLTEFYDYTKALCLLTKPAGNRIMVVTSSGGSGILATDTAEEHGLEVVGLESALQQELRAILPEQCVVANPLDLTGDATAERYENAVQLALTSSQIDMVLLIFGDPIPGATQTVMKLRQLTNKPIVVSYLGGGDVEAEETRLMQLEGIAVFPTPERAIKAVGALLRSK